MLLVLVYRAQYWVIRCRVLRVDLNNWCLLFILFQGRVGLVKNGLTNYYRFLDAGMRDKEAKSTAVVEKHKNNKQNLDTSPAEYKLPLVWIDLEMTGKIVFGFCLLSICLLSISKVFYKSILDNWMESNHPKEERFFNSCLKRLAHVEE